MVNISQTFQQASQGKAWLSLLEAPFKHEISILSTFVPSSGPQQQFGEDRGKKSHSTSCQLLEGKKKDTTREVVK